MKLISIGDGKGKNAMVGIAPYYKKIKKEERDNGIITRYLLYAPQEKTGGAVVYLLICLSRFPARILSRQAGAEGTPCR